MNLREGTRRLALLLGAVGAIAGGFASYVELQATLEQRASHNRFEQLAASDVVEKERKILQARTRAQETPPKIDPQTGERVQPSPDQGSEAAEEYERGHSEVNMGGIKTINWDVNHVWNGSSGIYSIDMQDGQTLYPRAAPAAWEYLLVALLPILGFVIPWGAIRAIGWAGAGFVKPVN